jgi:hypothetical protein
MGRLKLKRKTYPILLTFLYGLKLAISNDEKFMVLLRMSVPPRAE